MTNCIILTGPLEEGTKSTYSDFLDSKIPTSWIERQKPKPSERQRRHAGELQRQR